jgi:hypothetical protein
LSGLDIAPEASLVTYPAPITTIFNGRATKALGIKSDSIVAGMKKKYQSLGR